MTEPRYKRFDQYIGNPSVGAGRLVAHARRIEALDRAVRELLDSELAAHCRVLNCYDDQLVIAADSPVWATRLRYHTAALPDALASVTGQRFSRVVTRVSPPGVRQTPVVPSRPAPGMSTSAARQLESVAATVMDPELAAALRRLARNGA